MESTINRTLESIIDQRRPADEILVIDGGSDDGTMATIEEHRSQLTTVVSEPDNGLYDAINKGLALATGEVISILNGDDYYANDDVLQLYADSFEDSGIGIAFGDLEFFLPGAPERTIRTYSSAKFEPARLAYGWMPPHPTVFVRRSVYEAVGSYNADYRIAADFEFLIRALLIHQVKYKRIGSIVVRMQYGGLSTAGIRATYILNREIIRACRENSIETSWTRIMRKFPQKLLEFSPHVKRGLQKRKDRR